MYTIGLGGGGIKQQGNGRTSHSQRSVEQVHIKLQLILELCWKAVGGISNM
jgi:hypothetical protein